MSQLRIRKIYLLMVPSFFMVEATIEDLAIQTRPSRESDEVRRRCCIEHDFTNGLKYQTIMGTETRVVEIGC